MLSHMSGRAARGSGYTISGLCLPASLASLMGSVIKCLADDPEKGLVGGCWRAGEERPNPSDGWQSNPVRGQSGSVYIPPDFRVVQAKWAISILIGCWVGML